MPGLRDAIEDATASGTPFLGICVGMQLMAERGLEHGETAGFGWMRGRVARMDAPGLRLPQMGWNELAFTPGAHPAHRRWLEPGDHGYFVHSYALGGHDPAECLVATTDYGGRCRRWWRAATAPARSSTSRRASASAWRILANFLRWTP